MKTFAHRELLIKYWRIKNYNNISALSIVFEHVLVKLSTAAKKIPCEVSAKIAVNC